MRFRALARCVGWTIGALFAAGRAPSAAAQCVGCSGGLGAFPDAEVQLEFSRTFTGSYRHGEPFDVVTIDPTGTGETFEDAGITLRLRIFCSNYGQDIGPICGLAAEEVILFSTELCMCAYMTAARPPDDQGWTEFTGTIPGGGCAQSLMLFVDGIGVTTVPIRINSPDTVAASPCFVDASDLSDLARRLGAPSEYTICSDYNEDGAVDASDISFFAAHLGARCP